MKKLLIISGKGGTGKTTVAAAVISLLGVKVFGDCDVDAPNLHLLSSFKEEPRRSDFSGSSKAFVDEKACMGCGLCAEYCRFDAIKIKGDKAAVSDYACEGCGVCEYLCPNEAIKLFPAVTGMLELYHEDRTFSTAELKMGNGNSGKLVTKVKEELFEAADEAPAAVLDGAPGVGCPVIASLSGADLALVVAEPTLSGKSDLLRILKTVSLNCVKAAVCVNKYDINPEITEKIKEWCAENDIPYLGSIPYDKKVLDAVNCGKSAVGTGGEAARALSELCKNIKAQLEKLDHAD